MTEATTKNQAYTASALKDRRKSERSKTRNDSETAQS